MENILSDDDDIRVVLEVSAKRKRKTVDQITPQYWKRKKKDAELLTREWIKNGIPPDVYKKLLIQKPSLVEKLGLQITSAASNQEERSANQNKNPQLTEAIPVVHIV